MSFFEKCHQTYVYDNAPRVTFFSEHEQAIFQIKANIAILIPIVNIIGALWKRCFENRVQAIESDTSKGKTETISDPIPSKWREISQTELVKNLEDTQLVNEIFKNNSSTDNHNLINSLLESIKVIVNNNNSDEASRVKELKGAWLNAFLNSEKLTPLCLNIKNVHMEKIGVDIIETAWAVKLRKVDVGNGYIEFSRSFGEVSSTSFAVICSLLVRYPYLEAVSGDEGKLRTAVKGFKLEEAIELDEERAKSLAYVLASNRPGFEKLLVEGDSKSSKISLNAMNELVNGLKNNITLKELWFKRPIENNGCLVLINCLKSHLTPPHKIVLSVGKNETEESKEDRKNVITQIIDLSETQSRIKKINTYDFDKEEKNQLKSQGKKGVFS